MTYCPDMEFEIERARRMTAKDHRQRWVYMERGCAHITESPVPYRDAVSVYWMPIVGCTAYSWRPRAIAHNAIGAL